MNRKFSVTPYTSKLRAAGIARVTLIENRVRNNYDPDIGKRGTKYYTPNGQGYSVSRSSKRPTKANILIHDKPEGDLKERVLKLLKSHGAFIEDQGSDWIIIDLSRSVYRKEL